MARRPMPRRATHPDAMPAVTTQRTSGRSRRRRGALALAGSLVALLVAASAALWRLSDVEGALDAAAARLARSTDLVLSHGPVGVTVGRRLGVAVDDVALVDRRRGRTLFDASSVVIAVELAPLARGSVELREIVAVEPRLFGRRDADGTVDLLDAVDRVVAAARADGPAEPVRRRRFVTHFSAERIEIQRARLDWLDELHPRGPERAVLEPVDATVSRDRDTRSLVLEARALLVEPRPRSAGGVPPATTLTLRGSLSGFGHATGIADATWDADLGAVGVELALLEPWLTPALGAGSTLAGRARVTAHARGSWADVFSGRIEAVVDDARVAVPSAWGEPQRFRRAEVRARVERRPRRWSVEDATLAADDVTLAVRGAVDDPAGADPALDLEVTSPWLDLATVRGRVPTRALGHVFEYFARVIEEGQGRIDRLTVRGRRSQLAALGERANHGTLSGRFSFAEVAGTPHAGLDRISGVGGTLVLEGGDLALVGFTGRSGDSDLGRVTGEVRDLWGTSRSEVRADGADVALADVTRLLASDLFPTGARTVVGDLDIDGGRASGRATLRIANRQPIRFSGNASLAGGAVAVRSRDVRIAELAGPLAFSDRQLASTGLTFRLGGSSSMRVAGSVADYGTRAMLALAVEGRGVPAAEIERLLSPAHAGAPVTAGRVSGTVRLEGRLDEPASLLRAATLDLDRVDIGPPLLAQALDDVTGHVALDAGGLRFDVASLVWRGHRAAASGRVTGLAGPVPHVEVEGRALEPLDLEGVVREPASRAQVGPPPRSVAKAPAAGAGMEVEGRYDASEARYRGTAIRDLVVGFTWRDGTLVFDRVTGASMGGSFDVRATVRPGGGARGATEIELAPAITGVAATGLSQLLDLPWKKITGRADVSGEVRFAWPPKQHMEALQGSLEVHLRDGRIFEAVALWKVLDLVDFSRWITSPMGWREMGLAYDELRGHLELGASRVVTRDFSLSGPTVDLALDATLGLADRSVDALVTVSPLQLVDQVVDPIPLVGPVKRALDLTSYSFRLQGTLGSIRVTPTTLDRVDTLLEQVVPGGDPRRDAERRAP